MEVTEPKYQPKGSGSSTCAINHCTNYLFSLALNKGQMQIEHNKYFTD